MATTLTTAFFEERLCRLFGLRNVSPANSSVVSAFESHREKKGVDNNESNSKHGAYPAWRTCVLENSIESFAFCSIASIVGYTSVKCVLSSPATFSSAAVNGFVDSGIRGRGRICHGSQRSDCNKHHANVTAKCPP